MQRPFNLASKSCLVPTTVVVYVALALLAAPLVSQAAEIIGKGDFVFYLDTTAFKGRGGHALQEIYVRIPNNEISFKESGNAWEGKVQLTVLIETPAGEAVIRDSEEMTFTEQEKERVNSSLYFQTIIKSYFVKPGVYLLSYAVEDLEGPKATMMGRIQNKNKTSAVRSVRLETPDIPEDEPSFSQVMYLWSVDPGPGHATYHPNPPRLYGLYKDTLAVYLELYLPDSLAQAPTFEFKSFLLDGGGETVAESQVSLPNPRTREGDGQPAVPPGRGAPQIKSYPVLIREDLTKFPAGTYSLQFSFGLGGKTISRVRGGAFSVAWDMRTWEVARRNYHLEARFLLGDKAYEEFDRKSLGDQERMLDAMWKELDPTPETGVNEAYEEFLRRLAYVNDRFSGYEEAIYSARGQIYMKWGPPDDVIQDVVPVNRETLSEAVEMVENKFHTMNYSTHGVKPYNTATSNRIVDTRGVGTIDEDGNTGYPYELWIYNGSGKPILERDRFMNPQIGMRYLFIDREGYGRYTLESSSAFSSK